MAGTACGWDSDFPEFSRTPPRVIRIRLNEFVRDAGDEQVRAWDRSIPWLQKEAAELVHSHDEARSFTAILEYELPLEQRRPDLIVLENGAVVVIELKGKDFPSQGDLDQVAAYARDLRNYHRECHHRMVHAVLVPERAVALDSKQDGVRIISRTNLGRVLQEFDTPAKGPPASPDAFLAPGAYSPLPTLVQAARILFAKKDLPAIHRARAATDPALASIKAITHDAYRDHDRRLVLITGLPGSGKTLVGLRLAHSTFLDDLAVERDGAKPTAPAVFLSGNDPLVTVLQDALKGEGGDGKVFVRRVRDYRLTYSKPGAPAPPQHVLVFDEAQRAFDEGFLKYKHGKKGLKGPVPVGSEPDQFVRFAERIPRWCAVVALIGSGQEIFSGEDGGLGQWREAIENAGKPGTWTVHAPPELREFFDGSGIRIDYRRELNLNTELRFHAATDIHHYVEKVLRGQDSGGCRAVAARLDLETVRFFVTRDLELAKSYARDRYESHREARYGLVASSKDKILPAHGIANGYAATKFNLAPWFNAPKGDAASCCQFDRVATEFGIQGLEVDLAILGWGSDYARVGGTWSIARSGGYQYPVSDPEAIRRNVYRVLLTRGRDGTVVFVPPDPYLDETYRFLKDCGFRELPDHGKATK
jgi:hypothetical protein